MSAIEFAAQSGKTFSVQLYNALTGASIGSPITGVTDGTTPTLYRASTGSQAGKVFAVATAINLRVAGFADLDSAPNGYSALRDTYAELLGSGVTAEEIQAINSDLLQAILNGGMVATSTTPTVGDTADRDLHSDWELTIPASTDVADKIIFAIGVRTDEPKLEVDSETGLLTGTDATLATVTRLSATSVSVLIKAAALVEFVGYGFYEFELKTINGTTTKLKYRADVSFRSGVSKEIA